jgi:hypothetical protein
MLSRTVNHKFKLSRWALSLASLLLASVFCTTALAGKGSSSYSPVVETLHGLTITEKLVIVTVTSTGCTSKEDFIAVLQKSQPPIVTFIRLKPDLCRAASRKINISFSVKEVGADFFTVANPFKPGPKY